MMYLIGSAATRKWRRGVRPRWGRRRWSTRAPRSLRSGRKGPKTRPWSRNAPTRRTAWATTHHCRGVRTRSSWWWNWAATCSPTPSTWPIRSPSRRASPAGCGCTRRRSAACPLCWPCDSCCCCPRRRRHRRCWLPTNVRCSIRCRTTWGCADGARRSPCWPAWPGCVRGRCVGRRKPVAEGVRRSPGWRTGSVSWLTLSSTWKRRRRSMVPWRPVGWLACGDSDSSSTTASNCRTERRSAATWFSADCSSSSCRRNFTLDCQFIINSGIDHGARIE